MRRFQGVVGWGLTTLVISYALIAAVLGALAGR